MSFDERVCILVCVDKLTIRLAGPAFELEIKGEATAATRLYSEITQHGLGKLTPQFFTTNAKDETPNTKTQKDTSVSLNVNQLLYKDVIETEAEWVLMYGFFIMRDTQQDFFSRDQMLEYYKQTNRYTRNRSKSLTFNLRSCIKKGWLEPLNKTDFIITEVGLEQVYRLAGVLDK